MSSFGVTSAGFANKRQADWLAELNQAFLTQFGSSTNLGPDTVLGQFAGIFSERFALLSEALQDTYNSQNPQAAEGVAVDFALALLGLSRLPAAATTTNPTADVLDTGVVLPGLVLYGEAGTVVPAGCILQTASAPVLNFALDAAVTIGAAANAVQNIVFSQAPTQGNYTLTLTTPAGAALTTSSLAHNASAQAVQAAIVGLTDNSGATPFTDVVVQAPAAQLLTVRFGAAKPATGQPASGALAQPRIVASPQSLLAGNAACALSVAIVVQGQPAQGTGSATCTTTGPNSVLAGQLSVVGSAQQGLGGVTNPLDCLTGRDTESDTDALLRRNGQLAARGRGTLAGLLTQVGTVAGVEQVLGYQNDTLAAQQLLSFSGSGAGSFALVIGGQTTAAIAAPATAASIQAAVTALPGLGAVQVAGSLAYGYTFDFGAVSGGVAQAAIQVTANTTSAMATVRYGRPAKSFELVVQGGDDTAVAQAIFDTAPAGICAYGAPVAVSTGSTTAGSTALALADATGFVAGLRLDGYGVVEGATVLSVSGNVVQMSIPARSTYSSVSIAARHAALLLDGAGNQHSVAFSRPQPVVLYVTCQLLTDYYLSPGDPTSGINPQAKFDPASLAVIQGKLVAAAQAVPIGGTVTARGTAGLQNAFRDVGGINDVTLFFDTTASPTNTANIVLLSEQVLSVQTADISVSFT